VKNTAPLAMLILINNRDEVKKRLFKEAMLCDVHWYIINELWTKEYPESI